ncbi:hypothetical protein AN958_03325 [Leucoagaricus sp. SymC.cos]|nr:hypothetical protein AN958_03325 [Leucoagaricus sp. SymC.cos]
MSTLCGVRAITNNAFNNSVVDLAGSGDTANVIGFNFWGGHNQKWNLVQQTEADIYHIQSVMTGTYISVDGSNLVGSPDPMAWTIVQDNCGYRIYSGDMFWTLGDGKPGTQASPSYLPILTVES